MLSRVPFIFVSNLADVDGIGEQVVERSSTERIPASAIAGFGHSDRGRDTAG
jgi:hypothetical protein